MAQTRLKLSEINALQFEITGFPQSNGSVVGGLINEKINLVFKYWLEDLLKKIEEHVTRISKYRNDLISQYGTKGDGDEIMLSQQVDGQVNPKFIAFSEAFSQLLDETVEINHHDFKLAELESVTSSHSYSVFFKLIQLT